MIESNLEDRAAIHDLFTRYCCALDNGEIEAVVDCFTVDAILKSPVIDISGRDEIRAFAGRFAAQRASRDAPLSRLIVTALRTQHNPPCRRSLSPAATPPKTTFPPASAALSAPQLQFRISTSLTDVTPEAGAAWRNIVPFLPRGGAGSSRRRAELRC
jgi:SnoaL-like domain